MYLAGLGDDCATADPGTICGYDSQNVPIYASGTSTTQLQVGQPPLSPGALQQALEINTGLPSGETFNPYTGNIQTGPAPAPSPAPPIPTTGGGPMGPTPLPSNSGLIPGVSNTTLFLAAGIIGAAALLGRKR